MRISDWSSDVCSSDLFSPAAIYIDHFQLPALLFGDTARVVVSVAVWAHGERLAVAGFARHRFPEIRMSALARAIPPTNNACQRRDVAAVLLAAQAADLGEHHCRPSFHARNGLRLCPWNWWAPFRL